MMSIEEVDSNQPCLVCGDACLGFVQHPWRKVCDDCKCFRLDHDIFHDNLVSVEERLQMRMKNDPVTKQQKERALSIGYSWVPVGLSVDQIEEYMNSLPNHCIPRLHSAGQKNRDRRLIEQLPRQDILEEYCKHLNSPDAKKHFKEFYDYSRKAAFGIGIVKGHLPKKTECANCEGEIEQGELGVYTERTGEDKVWHPFCFSCHTCDELLVDLHYFYRDGHFYDGRHFAETVSPRCFSCDELIFATEYTKAMNENFHSGHFCCSNCDSSLTGQRYVLRDEQPHCIKCYEEVFANNCEECGKKIGTDSKDLSFKEKHWHEYCFMCSFCKASLVDKPFACKEDQLFCSDCYDNKFAARCNKCKEVFKAGTKKMEFKGLQWHQKCFSCSICDNQIGLNSFVPKDNRIICINCYEEKYATKCTGCKKVVTEGGVLYRNEPWHRECFVCTGCSKELANQRFTSRDDKPYCPECFGENFAKKCTSCKKPITGIGGTKFITFEDRDWHNDCFNCARCSKSLVGEGFMTEDDLIICPQCIEQQ